MRKTISLFIIGFFLSIIAPAQEVHRIEGSPFPASSPVEELYFTSGDMSGSEQYSVGSLAGILARTKPMIIQWQYFHQEIIQESDLNIPILHTYSNDFTGLLTHFASRLDGYILCDPESASSHVAASLSGILNAVAIPTDIESQAIAAGLTKALDVTGKDELWALTNYGDVLNKDLAFFLGYGDIGLIDYAAYTGGLRFFDPDINGALTNAVYDFLNPGAMFYGWWVTEDGTVAKLSENSFKIIPSGGLKNISTFTNMDVPVKKQKERMTPFKVEEDVHTVCFVISDGDNVSWPVGAAYWDAWTWKNDSQSLIQLGWTLSPALSELTPLIYNELVQGLQTTPDGRNVAIASPSGLGYYFPSLSPNQPFHCEQLNEFMRKADMNIVNVIDADDGAHNPDEYLKQSNIDALFYYTYGAQYQGMHGAISWYKDKPSIGGRFVLWGNSEDDSEEINEGVRQGLANTLNGQSTNIYSEDGYSLVPVHAWTMNPHDVADVTQKLGSHVRVVAPDEFVWLIKKNVRGLPMGTGEGLRAEYYDDTEFGNLVKTQIDKEIDFEWDDARFFFDMGSDPFSVRWTGQIQPLYSEEYSFHINSNDGARLVINGTTLFDGLSLTGENTQSGNITLAAGEKYDITIEYRQQTANAICKFEWESASQTRQYVPFTQLCGQPLPSTGVVTAYDAINMEGFSAGFDIGSYNSEQLNGLGISVNDISSINLMEGFKAVLFSENNFTGDSVVITTSMNDLSDALMTNETENWTDKTVSLKVKANGVTDISGAFYLQNQSSKFYMDVWGGPGNTGYYTNIQQYSLLDNLNQVFQFFHQGDGVYRIMARHSKKVLTVEEMSFEENANVYQWTYHGSASQEFIVVHEEGDTYKFISTYTGMAICVASNSIEANVQMNTNNGQVQALWNLDEAFNREGNGDGLTGEYYNGQDFTFHKYTRIDPQINFDWAEGNPGEPIRDDKFSVRWTGSIEPRYTGTYTFYITSDNGRRVWVNDQLIIDEWVGDWGVTYKGTIYLQEMKKYNITVEYFEEVGGANIKLEWESNLELREVIPQSQLYSEMVTGSSPVSVTPDFSIHPNPGTDVLHVNGLEKPTLLEIYSSYGKKLMERKGTSVNIDKLAPGLYFLYFTVDGEQQFYKFIKR
jgi:hypothetical protein